MKERNIITLFLAFFVLVSLLFSYYLLYDVTGFSTLIGRDQSKNTVDANIATHSNEEYYQATQLKLTDILTFKNVIVRLDDQAYKVNQDDKLKTLLGYLNNQAIEVQDKEESLSPEEFNQLFNGNYLELQFAANLPLSVYDQWIKNWDKHEDSPINKVLIPLDENEEQIVYLIDGDKKSYVQAELNSELSADELASLFRDEKQDFTPVHRFLGAQGYHYLPVDGPKVDSQEYTLELLPESLYVSKMFSDGSDYSVPDSNSNMSVYKNYQYTLEINRQQQKLDYVINRISQGERVSKKDQVLNSFAPISRYEFWNHDFRIEDFNNSIATYRRYLNGMAIYSPLTSVDYGAAFVHLRNDASGEIYRYQSSLVNFYAHVIDQSQSQQLETGQEIYDTLLDYGYDMDQFSKIEIAYEWQSDMEDFKKVKLIPKWFLTLDHKTYSLDAIKSEEFATTWQDRMTNMQDEEEE